MGSISNFVMILPIISLKLPIDGSGLPREAEKLPMGG